MKRLQVLTTLEEIPWHQVRIRGVALSEKEVEAVSDMLKILRDEPDPKINSVDSPLERYDNGTCTQDNG